jgi:natural product precursor
MKNIKKINLVSLANNELSNQQLSNTKGGKNWCACRHYSNHNRSEIARRNAVDNTPCS